MAGATARSEERRCATPRRLRAFAPVLAGALLALLASSPALSQARTDPVISDIHVSEHSSLFDLATRFLRHLGTEAGNASAGPPLASNPQGGGADDQQALRYRAWFEGYGLWSHVKAQDAFPGDSRSTNGGVAGLGFTPVPGASFGASVDQSRTKIAILGLPQSATIDLTQVGANASFDSGPWTLALAAVHGFGDVDSQRQDIGNAIASANYGVKLWGALGELSYLWTSGMFRIVPKVGMDYARVQSEGFRETGSIFAVEGSDQTSSRTRVFAGAEFGNSWIVDKALFDLSVYGRAVDIVQQDIGALHVIGIGGPVSLQGVGESRLGVDAGAAATLRLSAMTRFYAAYDGRFRDNFTSHSGTIGLELRW